MKLLKKFFANIKNIKNLNKFIQIVLTFCLCFVITFFLTLIFNNKFKFIEKFTHSDCNISDTYRIYWFYGDLDSSDNKIFESKWKELTGNNSLIQNLPICYIEAPKNKNDQDETYSKFLELYPYAETAGNILLVLGKNLSDSTNQQTDSTNQQTDSTNQQTDSTNQQMNPVYDITYIKGFTDEEISYEIMSLISNFYDINNNS